MALSATEAVDYNFLTSKASVKSGVDTTISNIDASVQGADCQQTIETENKDGMS